MGYRFDLDNKVITYCTDTGVCSELKKLAKNADLLILECSYLSGEHHKKWPHLNPEETAQVAKASGAGRLVLTHFDAGRYDTMAKSGTRGSKASAVPSATNSAEPNVPLLSRELLFSRHLPAGGGGEDRATAV